VCTLTAPTAGSHVEVDVWYAGDPYGESDPPPRTVTITGRAEERFIDALARVVGPPHEHHRYSLVHPQARETRAWLGEITPQVTMADAVEVAGGELLYIDVLGRGGGPTPYMWDIAEAGLKASSVYRGGAAVVAALDAARQRNKRAAAKEWLDSGIESEPTMELRQFVYEEREWTRKAFDRTFDLGKLAGPELLRRLRYRKISTQPEIWTDESE
jgi:hypothetical protein